MRRPRFRFAVKEDPIQAAVVRIFGYMGRPDVRLVHVPNELADTDMKRFRQKRLGLWPGCPDLIFLAPIPEPTTFIECKRTGKNIASGSTQDDARAWCLASGHNWALVNDPDQIIPTLERFGLLRLHAVTGGVPCGKDL